METQRQSKKDIKANIKMSDIENRKIHRTKQSQYVVKCILDPWVNNRKSLAANALFT